MKMIAYLALLLLTISLVKALNYGEGIYGKGLYGVGQSETVVETTSGSTSGNVLPSRSLAYNPYSLFINISSTRFEREQVIYAEIIINKSLETADNNGTLIYYILDSNLNVYGRAEESVINIGVGESIFKRTISLPAEPLFGNWSFHAEYIPEIFPSVKAIVPFVVMKEAPFLQRKEGIITVFSIFGILVLYSLSVWMADTKKKSKKEKEVATP